MRCYPDLTKYDDEPFWVSREVFLQHFDQDDFHDRGSKDVVHSYLAEWFHTPTDGTPRFMLPTVQFIAGKTQFINGRHRTAVLMLYLDELPIAFAFHGGEARDFLRRLALRPLDLYEFIELPDLPVVEHLP
jgi:hypothetical protein